MAHIRQKFTLGAIGGLGRLLGFEKLAIAGVQVRGAGGYFILQVRLMLLQSLIALLNLCAQFVESVDQDGDLVALRSQLSVWRGIPFREFQRLREIRFCLPNIPHSFDHVVEPPEDRA